jgi:hypothetical protein
MPTFDGRLGLQEGKNQVRFWWIMKSVVEGLFFWHDVEIFEFIATCRCGGRSIDP